MSIEHEHKIHYTPVFIIYKQMLIQILLNDIEQYFFFCSNFVFYLWDDVSVYSNMAYTAIYEGRMKSSRYYIEPSIFSVR